MTGGRWTLPAALGIGDGPELVALVGGGGKTSLMFALAAQLPSRVVMTTTTRIFAAQMKRAPVAVYEDDLSPLDGALDAHGHCLVVGRVEGEKSLGVSPDLPTRLLARHGVDFVLVEADGSRMRPVKAPADHEPVIPPGTTLLVAMAGMDALEGAVDDVAHRPELVRGMLGDDGGYWDGERLTAAGLAELLAHPRGGLKNASDGARIVVFLNKVDTDERLAAARETARHLLDETRVGRVVLGAIHGESPVVEVRRRVAAAVLAAGTSSRMGRNKLLLPWGGATVLEQTLSNVRASGVGGVVVITGHEHDRAEALAASFGSIVWNTDYAKGMLSSAQTAARHLPPEYEAMLVVLGDQPLVGPYVIDALLDAYAAKPHGLVAPTYRGQRGNPVLIARRYFAELLNLPPDGAPRLLLQRHADDLCLVEVDTDAILQDLDRPEDYARLRPG